MKQKLKVQASWLQTSALRVTRIHFFYIAAYMISVVAFDSWNLFTHQAINDRWTAAGVLLVINIVIWYVSRIKFSTEFIYVLLVLLLVAADIVFAAYNVYWERGLASKAVALFAIPIVTAATLRSRSTLLAATALCVAGYSMAAMRYFNLHYGESYRIELYGYVAFYCAIFFVLAGLLWVMIKPTQENL